MERTLTLSGLSYSKTYNLELYASRANTGNSTTFSVNGNAITVLTDNNKATKVSFVNLKPTVNGQLIVTITNINAYNYLNGFILTENSSGSTLTVSQESLQKDEGLQVSELQLQASPNPSSNRFILITKSNKILQITLTVRDAVGRVVEVKQHLPATGNVPLGQGYRPGVYYAEVVQGSERKTIKLVKTAW